MHLRISKQRGLSLVESMIALLVISIGLLGIAALQVTSMSQNASALHQSQAVWAGYNMADRIRANITEFTLYIGVDTNLSYSRDCVSATCSTNQMVTADAEQWSTQIQNLPGGRGLITGNPNQLLITVMWDDEGTGAIGTNCSGNPLNDLTCYTVTLIQ